MRKQLVKSAPTSLLTALSACLLASGCGDSVPPPLGSSSIYLESQETTHQYGPYEGDNRVFITDRTGKRWDVTHARDHYGLQPSQYEFGLGPYAISPIVNPQMLDPGHPDYPEDGATFLVLGTSLNGFTRAYPIEAMSWHEIANEEFGRAHVAVAY